MLIGLVVLAAVSAVDAQDEFPKVVRRDGQVCVQTLEAGRVAESCRPEASPLVTSSADPWSGVTGGRRSAILLDDPWASRRAVAEQTAGTVVSAVVGGIFLGVCFQYGCSASGSAAFGLAQLGLVGLVSTLTHAANHGQGHVGFGLLGAGLGGAVGLLISIVTFSSGAGLLATVLLVNLAALLPAVGSVVALELRDASVRQQGVTVAQF